MESVQKLHLYTEMFFAVNKKRYLQLSDKELIDLFVRERCRYSIPILYERYGHLVMGSCLKYLRQTENAEDITMQIFGELGTKLLKHDVQHFKSWLYQVTRNECLQFLRKHQPGAITTIEQLQLPIQEEHELSPEKDLQLLEQAIEQLKDEQKQCIELFYLQQMSYAAISEQLDIPVNTVKSAIQNGKRNLKLWMERTKSNEG